MYGSESCKVTIFGDQYTLRTDLPDEAVMCAASMVDTMMKEIARAGMKDDAKSIAVLTALRLAHQLNSAPMSPDNSAAHGKLCAFIDLELKKLGLEL